MRICFISLFSYPLFNEKVKATFGGAEVQLFNIASELSKRENIAIDFIVGDFGQGNIENINGIRLIKTVKMQKRLGFFEKMKSFLTQFFALIKSNADVYVQRSAGIQTGMVSLYCLIFHKKFVYMTAHEWDCNGEYVKNNGFIGWFYKFGLKNAHIVITQSEVHRKLLLTNFSIKSQVLRSGYNVVHMNSFIKQDFVLWVARLVEWKKPETVFEIAKSLPNTTFVMIAPDSDNESYSKKMIEEAATIKNIKLITGLPIKETNEYFKKAKLFINTSKQEGFPNTFIQAAMYGTPIISLTINPDNVLELNRIGYCAESSVDQMKSEIVSIIGNSKRYKDISHNCIEYFKANHDIKKIAADFLLLIGK